MNPLNKILSDAKNRAESGLDRTSTHRAVRIDEFDALVKAAREALTLRQLEGVIRHPLTDKWVASEARCEALCIEDALRDALALFEKGVA